MDDYKFHEDWDIGEHHGFMEHFSVEDMRLLFIHEVEALIPSEYRHLVKYICEPTRSLGPIMSPFVGGWLYPGKRLAKERKERRNVVMR